VQKFLPQHPQFETSFEGKSHQLDAVIQTGADQGMQSMDKTLIGLVKAGTITYDQARNYAVDVGELDRMMRG